MLQREGISGSHFCESRKLNVCRTSVVLKKITLLGITFVLTSKSYHPHLQRIKGYQNVLHHLLQTMLYNAATNKPPSTPLRQNSTAEQRTSGFSAACQVGFCPWLIAKAIRFQRSTQSVACFLKLKLLFGISVLFLCYCSVKQWSIVLWTVFCSITRMYTDHTYYFSS